MPERDEIAIYLPELLRSVRSTYATLIKLDLPSEALDIIVKESALSTEQRETPLLENPSAQKEVDKQLDCILVAFHNVLNTLTTSEDYEDCDDSSPVVSQLIGTPVNSNKISTVKTNIPTWEHRLLITLSNCMFTKNNILDLVDTKFKESGFPSVEGPIKSAKIKLDNLEKSILDKYLEQKSDPLVGITIDVKEAQASADEICFKIDLSTPAHI
ncbi:hypothetical protein NQ317_016099 [Molorchus minor]|uniref:Exocyst complex component 2 n=1 Tax=Molorchus minor TaxID=1323400 RepID=A0ABQ9JIY8_9CUCU|nr:hypothetical protein NQ317_016099 [Molorchus minor]